MKEKLSRPVFQQVKLVWVWSDCFVVSSCIRRPQYQTRLVCHDQVPLTHSLPNFASLSLIIIFKNTVLVSSAGKSACPNPPTPRGCRAEAHATQAHHAVLFFPPSPTPSFLLLSRHLYSNNAPHTGGKTTVFASLFIYPKGEEGNSKYVNGRETKRPR